MNRRYKLRNLRCYDPKTGESSLIPARGPIGNALVRQRQRDAREKRKRELEQYLEERTFDWSDEDIRA